MNKSLILNDKLNSLLLLLAKRINNNVEEWSVWKFPERDKRNISDKESLIVICLICNDEIDMYYKSISEHGLLHLKEHNLLPFI